MPANRGIKDVKTLQRAYGDSFCHQEASLQYRWCAGPTKVKARVDKLIAIQTFRTMREGSAYHIDKTAYARRVLSEGSCYLLARARRLAKSLLAAPRG